MGNDIQDFFLIFDFFVGKFFWSEGKNGKYVLG